MELINDVKHASRLLLKSPLFFALSALSLAMGIGATTAIFSIANDILLTRLPVKQPEQLVEFQWQRSGANYPMLYDETFGGDIEPASGAPSGVHFPQRTLDAFRRENTVLSQVFAVAGLWNSSVTIDRYPEALPIGQLVSGNYYQTLGVSAVIGRTLLPEDDVASAPPACVISHHYWKTRFHEDPSIIGKTLRINQLSATIVGVAPYRFAGPMRTGTEIDITLPLAHASRLRRESELVQNSTYWWLRIGGRLASGISPDLAASKLQGIFREIAHNDLTRRDGNAVPRLLAVPGDRLITESARKEVLSQLVPLMWMAGLLLVAGCANVANLLLARGASRRREIAVKFALGASRARIVCQLLIEGLALASAGAILGLLLSRLNLYLFASLLPNAKSGYALAFQIDRIEIRVLAFVTLLSAATGIAFSIVPALRSTKLNLSAEFQGGTRSLGSVALSRFSQVLVAIQIAVSVTLLVCTGLFLRSLQNVSNVDLGFQREQRLLLSVDAQVLGYKYEQWGALYNRIQQAISSVPRVQSVSYSAWGVLTGENPSYSKFQFKHSPQERRQMVWNSVAPNFFETYGIPLVGGRTFDSHDDENAPRVAIINQAVVQRYFPDRNPIGERIELLGDREIVGVVRNARLTAGELRGATDPTVFIPFAQASVGNARFVVQISGPIDQVLPSIRGTLGDQGIGMALANVSTQVEQIEWRFLGQRAFAKISGFVGFLALVLVWVGVYGLMSYAVVRRTPEIGLRIALGALPAQVHWMIIRESLTIVLVGIVGGMAGAYAISQMLASMLLGLSPTDPVTYGSAAVFLLAVAVFACWWPARRAASVDPIISIKAE